MHTRFPLVCSTHADTFKAPPVAQLVVSVVLSPTTRVLSTATCCTWQHTHALEVQAVEVHTIRYHGAVGRRRVVFRVGEFGALPGVLIHRAGKHAAFIGK
jgi:hypothetical protein